MKITDRDNGESENELFIRSEVNSADLIRWQIFVFRFRFVCACVGAIHDMPVGVECICTGAQFIR